MSSAKIKMSCTSLFFVAGTTTFLNFKMAKIASRYPLKDITFRNTIEMVVIDLKAEMYLNTGFLKR